VPEPEAEPEADAEGAHEPEGEKPVRKAPRGSVSGKLVDPEVIRGLEPLARRLLELGAPEVSSSSSRAKVVAEDVQTALAVVRACTLHPNPDGSLPLKRAKALWDRAYRAGDTTRAFCWHRFKAVRDMLTDMGLLEWEDSTYRFGRACRWRAGEKLMGMMEEALRSGSTSTPLPSTIVGRNIIAEAQQERPDQVGLRPKMVFPSLLREDWDEKLVEAGLEHLARRAA